jgi:hypothetical protein
LSGKSSICRIWKFYANASEVSNSAYGLAMGVETRRTMVPNPPVRPMVLQWVAARCEVARTVAQYRVLGSLALEPVDGGGNDKEKRGHDGD